MSWDETRHHPYWTTTGIILTLAGLTVTAFGLAAWDEHRREERG